MSYRGGKPKKRLPSRPEGEKRDERVDRLRKKQALVGDVERMLAIYRDDYHRPLELRVAWLELPFYKRWWSRLKVALDRVHTLYQKYLRWRYIKRWTRLEKRGDHAGEEGAGE